MTSKTRWLLVVVAACAGAVACASGTHGGSPTPTPTASPTPAPSRSDVIVAVLTDANAPLIADRADQVAAMYQKMAASPFAFMRGDMPLFEHDLAADAALRALLPTSESVLAWDPHPENFGTRGHDGVSTAPTWDDFDGASVGPIAHDLLRGAVAVSLLVRWVDTSASSHDAVVAFLDAYAANAGGPTGTIIDDMVAKAVSKGNARSELGDIGPGPALVTTSASRIALDAPAQAAIAAALPGYEATRLAGAPTLGPLRDAVEVFGSGVASVPLRRFELELAGAAPDGSQDVLLEAKEVFDRHRDANGNPTGSTLLGAESALAAMRTDSPAPDLDLNAGILRLGTSFYSVTTVTGYARGLDKDDLRASRAGGTYSQAQLMRLAQDLGTALAEAHARGGAAPASLDTAAVAAAVEVLANGAVSDHALFVARLSLDGPLLGATP